MRRLLFGLAFLAAGCPPPPSPNPAPNPKPSVVPTADAAPPKPAPHVDAATQPPLPSPSDRFGLACTNIGRLGCADYDPKTCAGALRVALEKHISPTLTDKTVECLGVAPTKVAARACGFEKCP